MKIAITGKGGVGKTTFAATLARLYAEEGRTVLAADVDPDANLGLALGFPEEILDSIIIGLLCFIGCSFLGMPYTMLVSVIVGVTNVIPFFGPFIGAIPSALIILIADPIKCIYFLLFVLLLQQFDGNILGPKILGDSTGLSSFWVLFAIVLFGGLFGFLGMLLGVPAFAIFYALISGLAKASLRKKGLSDKTTDYVLVESIDPADHTYKTIKDPSSKS